MKKYYKYFVGAGISAFVCPLFWSLGDAVQNQAGIHNFDVALFFWSISLGMLTAALIVAGLVSLDNFIDEEKRISRFASRTAQREGK